MKTTKLEAVYEFDFSLIGLVCNIKDFKLAWHLNRKLKIELQKMDDLKIEFSNKTSILISYFKYENEVIYFELLKNKLISGSHKKQQLLIPELKQFDYLIKFRDLSFEMDSNILGSKLKEIEIIEYAMNINFDSLKSKENLLY